MDDKTQTSSLLLENSKRKLNDEQQQQQQSSNDLDEINKKLKTSNDNNINEINNKLSNDNNDHNNNQEIKLESNNQENIELNPIFNEQQLIVDIQKHYYDDDDQIIECNNLSYNIIKKPFKVVQLFDIIENNDNDKINEIIDISEKTIRWTKRNNDLLSLKQSMDLKNYNEFNNIVEFFNKKIKNLLENITNLKLNDNDLALTFSKYEQYDYLLCHDDQLDQRKIAFILYLVDKQWSDNDGGQLELFSIDEDNLVENNNSAIYPKDIVEKITPKSNTLLFFEVNNRSFHQVGEILTNRSSRLSINGWFHSVNNNNDNNQQQKILKQNLYYPKLLSVILHNDNNNNNNNNLSNHNNEHFKQWINSIYLDKSIQKQIRKSFNENSEIQLKNFLINDKYEQLSSSLSSKTQILWKNNYHPLFFKNKIIKYEQLPNILQEFYLFINSIEFYKFISLLTGVKFEQNNNNENDDSDDDDDDDDDVKLIENNPQTSSIESKNYKIRSAIIEWNHGDYTLSSDINPDINERALDLDLFFNIKPLSLIKSTKNFGDQEIINISDDDDDDNGDKEEKENDSNEEKTKINEPELIELDSDDDDDDDDCENKIVKNINEEEEAEIKNEENDDCENNEKNDDDDDDEESEINNDDDDDLIKSNGGGYISYITDESDEPLLLIEPDNNYLNIVYRNRQCQRFMKYIDHSNERVPFQHLSIVFSEK